MAHYTEDSFTLRVFDIDKVKKSKVVYSSRSDTAKHLALVGTFLAAVQAQFILITYLENSKPSEQAVNAFFFLGQILDIFGTYYGLKEYNLYHWYLRMLEDLHDMMNDSKDDLAEIARLVHRLKSGEEEAEKEIMNLYPDSSNRVDSNGFSSSDDQTKLQELYRKESIVKISKEYDRLRLLISKPNIEDVSSVGVLHCVVTNPLRLIVRPWTTIRSLQIVITKPVHGFRFSPIHCGIDCFVLGLVIFLITSQPKGVWLLSLLAIALLVIHQEIIPRINRLLLAREMIQAEQYSILPIVPHEWFIYHSADFLLYSPNPETTFNFQKKKINNYYNQRAENPA